MTKEEMKAKLPELEVKIREKVVNYNTAVFEDKLKEAADIEKEVEDMIGEYAGYARTICFSECAEAENPMIEAVKRLRFEVIGTHDKNDENSTHPMREVVKKEKPIDLLALNRWCKGIGADKNWPYIAEKFNMLMTAQMAIDLGIDPTQINSCYYMSEISKGISLGTNPTSKTKILATLREVIKSMIGEEYVPAVLSKDVNFLFRVYSKKSRKALTVTAANHKSLVGFLAEICNRVVTGGMYDIDYKRVK